MNSLTGWIAEKNYLKKEITKRFPAGIKRYMEVFGGAAWVLLYKDFYAEMEVYNDCSSDLENLFRCEKYRCNELLNELQLLLNSREAFEDFKTRYKTGGLNDIQRAARFFMLLKASYGNRKRNYGCIKKSSDALMGYLYSVSKRFAGVVVENRDFQELIKIYDRPDTFLYLDPPYYGKEKYYQAQFNHEDHGRLFRALKNTKGKFLLSYNDCEFVRKLYKDFTIEEIRRNKYPICGNKYRGNSCENSCCELLIRNY